MNKDIVLVETMFKYADMGINPVEVLTESAGTYIQSSIILESSGDAAGLFSKLNDGRKELMKKIENIDWKEWVKKMKETVAKIIKFITAPARTAADLATGKTTLKEVGQRLKQVLTNLKNKKNKTPEEKNAEKAVGGIIQDVEKASNVSKQSTDSKIPDSTSAFVNSLNDDHANFRHTRIIIKDQVQIDAQEKTNYATSMWHKLNNKDNFKQSTNAIADKYIKSDAHPTIDDYNALAVAFIYDPSDDMFDMLKRWAKKLFSR